MMDLLLPRSMTARLLDLWDKEGDKFMMNYWLMGNPFSMLTVILVLYISIYVLGPRYSKSLHQRDLRPIMLIANGTVFGIIGMGFMLGLSLTSFGTDCCKCDGSLPQDDDLRTAALKMIAFMYVMTKLLEFQRPLFASLRGSSASDHYMSPGNTLFLFGQLFMSYIGGVFYPGGPLVFWPMFDALVMIGAYGYLVLRLASPELHPSPMWIKVISILRFMSCFFIMIHSYVFSQACATTSTKMAYLLNVSFYYNSALVAAQIASFLWAKRGSDSGRDQRTFQKKRGNEHIINNNKHDIAHGH